MNLLRCYSSRELDGESGLYLMGARHYDPNTGRFLQEDPVPSINQFAYAANNPIVLNDPLGLCPSAFRSFLGGLKYGSTLGFFDPDMGDPTSRAFLIGMTVGAVTTAASGARLGLAAVSSIERGIVLAVESGESNAVRVGDYTLSDTVANHMEERLEDGRLNRPFLQSPLITDEIVATGQGRPDPGGLAGALRYDVPGTFRGSEGTWQLVVDSQNRIVHYNFSSKP